MVFMVVSIHICRNEKKSLLMKVFNERDAAISYTYDFILEYEYFSYGVESDLTTNEKLALYLHLRDSKSVWIWNWRTKTNGYIDGVYVQILKIETVEEFALDADTLGHNSIDAAIYESPNFAAIIGREPRQ